MMYIVDPTCVQLSRLGGNGRPQVAPTVTIERDIFGGLTAM